MSLREAARDLRADSRGFSTILCGVFANVDASRTGPNSAERWLADFLGQLHRDNLAPATVRGYCYNNLH